MAEIIEFNRSVDHIKKIDELTEKLEAKEKELLDIKTENATVRSINEMLKLQLAELRCVINEQINNLELIKNNISNLEDKLP